MSIAQIRAALRNAFGARKYRITASGDIHVFGVMPNTNQEGWYLFGYVADDQTIDRIQSL